MYRFQVGTLKLKRVPRNAFILLIHLVIIIIIISIVVIQRSRLIKFNWISNRVGEFLVSPQNPTSLRFFSFNIKKTVKGLMSAVSVRIWSATVTPGSNGIVRNNEGTWQMNTEESDWWCCRVLEAKTDAFMIWHARRDPGNALRLNLNMLAVFCEKKD